MSNFLFRGAIAVFGLGALYIGSSQNARADDWGCKVILCLSNPGGATQYAQCRPPVQKLWWWLARGKVLAERLLPMCEVGTRLPKSVSEGSPSLVPERRLLLCAQD